MTTADAEARALIEQVFPPLPPATCTTGRVVALASATVDATSGQSTWATRVIVTAAGELVDR